MQDNVEQSGIVIIGGGIIGLATDHKEWHMAFLSK
jgi:hypothetical protein